MATDADAQAWIDDVVADGGTVRDETAIDNFVIKLKNDGVWAKLDHLWLRKYAGSEIAALKSLKSLRDSINYGATFNDDEGFIGDGVDDHIETKARDGGALVNLVQNSAHYGVKYKDGDGIQNDGASGRKGCNILRSGGFTRYRVNGGLVSFLGDTADGYLVAVREVSTESKLYKNGTLIDTQSDTSTAPNSGDFASLGLNTSDFSAVPQNIADHVSGTEEVVHMGGALTATDVSNLNTAISDFYTEVETPTGITISGITKKDGVTLVDDGTYVQHLYADDNKGTNETLLEVGQTTGGEVTFTGELPVGKVRFIRTLYTEEVNGVTRYIGNEYFYTD